MPIEASPIVERLQTFSSTTRHGVLTKVAARRSGDLLDVLVMSVNGPGVSSAVRGDARRVARDA